MTKVIRYFTAAVWLVNGLFCKVLGLVPRHEVIAAKILGLNDASLVILAIGVAEVLMAVWILSQIRPVLNIWTQIVVVLLMNTLEFQIASELLLFGKWNLAIAVVFTALLYYHLSTLRGARSV